MTQPQKGRRRASRATVAVLLIVLVVVTFTAAGVYAWGVTHGCAGSLSIAVQLSPPRVSFGADSGACARQ